MSENASIPPTLYEQLIAWLNKIEAYVLSPETSPALTLADHELLIAGLRSGDELRWEIGIADAEVRTDEADGSPFVVFHLRRPDGTAGTTFRLLDPEAAF